MSSPNKGEWLKPGDVLQKLKAKKRALKARINQGIRKQALESSQLSCFKGSSQKRVNPFRSVTYENYYFHHLCSHRIVIQALFSV